MGAMEEVWCRDYSAAICKCGNMIEDARSLLGVWRTGEGVTDFADRARREGVLGGYDAARVRTAVNMFIARFVRPEEGRPALFLRDMLAAGMSGREYREMLFLFAARYDVLLFDCMTCWFWPVVHDGQCFNRRTVRRGAVRTFVEAKFVERCGVCPWSDATINNVASALLRVLLDFGFVRRDCGCEYEIVRYRLSDYGFLMMLYYLHRVEGVLDSYVCGDAGWSLFGMTPADVAYRLRTLEHNDCFVFQSAGSVTQITWLVDSVQDAINKIKKVR